MYNIDLPTEVLLFAWQGSLLSITTFDSGTEALDYYLGGRIQAQFGENARIVWMNNTLQVHDPLNNWMATYEFTNV